MVCGKLRSLWWRILTGAEPVPILHQHQQHFPHPELDQLLYVAGWRHASIALLYPTKSQSQYASEFDLGHHRGELARWVYQPGARLQPMELDRDHHPLG